VADESVTGSDAERGLLGAVLNHPHTYRFASEIASPDDFEDGRLGEIWSGIGRMVAAGETVQAFAVEDMFSAWNIRGFGPGDMYKLQRAYDGLTPATVYARTVQADAVRRTILVVTDKARSDVGDLIANPNDIAAELVTKLDALRTRGGEHAQLKTLAEVLAGSDEYDWVIDGLLERRDRLVLTGSEGAGKSTFVRQLAILSAAGIHPLTFRPIPPVRVLVVDAENTESQWRRATRFLTTQAAREGSADPAETIMLRNASRMNLTKGTDLADVHRHIDETSPDILFIGPLYRLTPNAINTDDDATPLLAALDTLRDRGVALVIEAHAGLAKGNTGHRDLRPRGSSALMGWPEFGLGIRPDEEFETDYEVVRWRGDRDARDWPQRMMRGVTWPWERI
jgi:replicative DNA helicase